MSHANCISSLLKDYNMCDSTKGAWLNIVSSAKIDSKSVLNYEIDCLKMDWYIDAIQISNMLCANCVSLLLKDYNLCDSTKVAWLNSVLSAKMDRNGKAV